MNYKLDVGSPEKQKLGDGDAFQDFSSGEEYRDKDDADSEYDPQEPMDVDALGDGTEAGKPPPLARLDDGTQRPHNAADIAAAQAAAMSAQHRRPARHDPEAERVLRARIDAMKIRDIRLAAETINAENVQKMLHRAQIVTTRTERGERARRLCVYRAAVLMNLFHSPMVAPSYTPPPRSASPAESSYSSDRWGFSNVPSEQLRFGHGAPRIRGRPAERRAPLGGARHVHAVRPCRHVCARSQSSECLIVRQRFCGSCRRP